MRTNAPFRWLIAELSLFIDFPFPLISTIKANNQKRTALCSPPPIRVSLKMWRNIGMNTPISVWLLETKKMDFFK